MATFKFVFRPSMKVGRHPGSLSLRVIHGRRPKTVSLSLRLYSEEWNGTTQTVVFPDDAPERIGYLQGVQERITACAGKVDDIIRQLDLKGVYTVGDVVEHYRESSDESKLLGYARTLSSELRRNGQYRTANGKTALFDNLQY